MWIHFQNSEDERYLIDVDLKQRISEVASGQQCKHIRADRGQFGPKLARVVKSCQNCWYW